MSDEIQDHVQETQNELTARQLVSVFLRVLAISTFAGATVLLAATAANTIEATRPDAFDKMFLPSLTVFLTVFTVTALVAGILWSASESLAERVVPNKHNGYVRFDLSYREIQALAFSLVGIMLLADGLPRIVQSLVTIPIRMTSHYGSFEPNLLNELVTPIFLGALVHILIAGALILRSEQIVKQVYFGRMRS